MDNVDTMSDRRSACGKIILSGEYAVVFGSPGIAVPSAERITVTLEPSSNLEPLTSNLEVAWPNAHEKWLQYADRIIAIAEKVRKRRGKTPAPPSKKSAGTLCIDTDLPLGKGMGSSTALVIAICRCLLGGDCRAEALAIEDAVNPGHSGMDFAVIWEEKPILFRKGSPPEHIDLPSNLLKGSRLIDCGEPGESTKDLVAWMQGRKDEPVVATALRTIGNCTGRIASGEPLTSVIRDHHRAQLALGVVRPEAERIIADIEAKGGAAKVLGAGARTGGGGIVLALP